ncbi:putative rRNA methylase YtqB isoform X2 [Mangifera indica]|uniref:putative rRNA methylase YtqB isoform X2 n=1 Tax=Mangifera indica TaxID=29780 RepID=UPI001CF95B61|nr:putative rRNA methylase YtqB isoform X2 [Mangifera indica]
MLSSRLVSLSYAIPFSSKTLFPKLFSKPKIFLSSPSFFHQKLNLSAVSIATSPSFFSDSPLSGLGDGLVGYVFGKKKATEVAHFVWKHVVQKGDTAVDATCGNGHDTLAMLKMVADESGMACVYGFDIQREALESTSSLLDGTVNQAEKGLVKLFNMCHSRMEEVIAKNAPVRLVAFNLGYLPGGDKTVITMAETTALALEAAERIVVPGGLISIVVYVGHPSGREELETVEAFADRLPVDNWICCKFQMLNRPLAPVLVFLFKR